MPSIRDPGKVAGGRKAARTAKLRYGGSYHREIGAVGGRSTAARHGRELCEDIGRKRGMG